MGLFNFGGVSKNEFEKLLEAYELLYRVAVYNRVALICITKEGTENITPEEAAEKLFGRFSIAQVNYIKELHASVNESADKKQLSSLCLKQMQEKLLINFFQMVKLIFSIYGIIISMP